MPVSYDSSSLDDAFPNLTPFEKINIYPTLLHYPHDSVVCAWEKLLLPALSGLTASFSDAHKYRVHIMTAYYIAGIVKAEDLLSLKRESMNSMPGSRCQATKDKFTHSKGFERRISSTQSTFCHCWSMIL